MALLVRSGHESARGQGHPQRLDLQASYEWFEKIGWAKHWDWAPEDGAPTFRAVESGECEIFLCLDGQGGRGREGGIGGDGQGVWLSIWVDDVDEIHARCVSEGLEVIHDPEDVPWGVREMHIRHPDGHVFRISCDSAEGNG